MPRLKTQGTGFDPLFFEQAVTWLDTALPVQSPHEDKVHHA